MSKQYFEKLNNNRFNSIKKLELSVIGDANMLLTETEEFKAMADGVFDNYTKQLLGLSNVIGNVGRAISGLETMMENASKFLDETRTEGQSILDMIDGGTKLQKDIEKTLDRIEKSAEELGVKVDNIDVYKKLVSQDNVIEGFIDNMSKRLDDGRESIDVLIDYSRRLNKISNIE